MTKHALIILGIESSGNHLFTTLFSMVRQSGVQLLGTDMLGWTDGKFKTHEEERFHDVWVNDAPLEVTESFVTGRSFPCGLVYPDVKMFMKKCEDKGFIPQVVVIIRSRDAVIKSSKASGKSVNIQQKLDKMLRQVDYLAFFVSYELLVLDKQKYFESVLTDLDPAFTIDNKWFDLIRNENAKYYE